MFGQVRLYTILKMDNVGKCWRAIVTTECMCHKIKKTKKMYARKTTFSDVGFLTF